MPAPRPSAGVRAGEARAQPAAVPVRPGEGRAAAEGGDARGG